MMSSTWKEKNDGRRFCHFGDVGGGGNGVTINSKRKLLQLR